MKANQSKQTTIHNALPPMYTGASLRQGDMLFRQPLNGASSGVTVPTATGTLNPNATIYENHNYDSLISQKATVVGGGTVGGGPQVLMYSEPRSNNPLGLDRFSSAEKN